MAGIVHITVEFEMKTHLVRDRVQNGWTFASATQSAVEIANAGVVLLNGFYNSPAHGPVVSGYLAHNVDRAVPAVAKCYQLSSTSATVVDPHGPGTGFGSPIHVENLSPYSDPSGSGVDLPEQVSVCLSYHGQTAGLSEGSGHSARLASRHRGRVYIGPLASAVLATDPTTGSPVINAGLLTALGANAAAMATGTAPSWVVWSRKNDLVDPVLGGFIDNRFDTQRRRLEAPTFRQIFP